MSASPEQPGEGRRSTRVSRWMNAPRATVYRTLLDPAAVARWKVPEGMTCEVHEFEARKGGRFRISLTYEAPGSAGKSGAQTDTYHGHFERLVPDGEVVEVMEFETSDPRMAGEMRTTVTLTERDGGTEVVGLHEGLPPGVGLADNELGWRMALGKLAGLVEG